MRKLPRGGGCRALRWVAAPFAALGLLLVAPAALAVNPTENDEQVSQKQQKKVQEVEEVVKKEPGEAEKKPTKPWFVDALFETHWLAIRDNQAADDVYSILYMRGNYDVPSLGPLPALGRFSLRMDITRRYISDPEESGFLFGDIRLYYSRGFAFKVKGQDFGGRVYFYWTFPTSRISRQDNNIARPTLYVALSKVLPYGITVFVRPFARLNWHRYAEKGGDGTDSSEPMGGALNDKWVLGYDLQAIYTFPLHKPLSFGGGWAQDWISKYQDRTGADSPWTGEYYWEIFAGYNFLTDPVDMSGYLALASGRKTFTDGVWRFRWVERNDTELYFSISAKY